MSTTKRTAKPNLPTAIEPLAVYTVAEAAAVLMLGVGTVYKLGQAGAIKKIRGPGVRFSGSSLIAYISKSARTS